MPNRRDYMVDWPNRPPHLPMLSYEDRHNAMTAAVALAAALDTSEIRHPDGYVEGYYLCTDRDNHESYNRVIRRT
jgi:hypothetical protein